MKLVKTELQRTESVTNANGKTVKQRVHDSILDWYCPDLSDISGDLPEPDKWEANIVELDGEKIECLIPVYENKTLDFAMKAVRDKALSISRARQKSDSASIPQTMDEYLESAGGMPITQQQKVFKEGYKAWLGANGYDAKQIKTYGERYIGPDVVAALEGVKLEKVVETLNKYIESLSEEDSGNLTGILRKYQDAITTASSDADAF